MFRLLQAKRRSISCPAFSLYKALTFLKPYYPAPGSLTGGSESDGTGKSGDNGVLVSGAAGTASSGEVGMVLSTAMWKVSFIVWVQLRGRFIPVYLLV
jgi:hypothetical protein